jgi:uncharacterized membrane protein YeaQ/YmgE (transglycosylase-associated protein family)
MLFGLIGWIIVGFIAGIAARSFVDVREDVAGIGSGEGDLCPVKES